MKNIDFITKLFPKNKQKVEHDSNFFHLIIKLSLKKVRFVAISCKKLIASKTNDSKTKL